MNSVFMWKILYGLNSLESFIIPYWKAGHEKEGKINRWRKVGKEICVSGMECRNVKVENKRSSTFLGFKNTITD